MAFAQVQQGADSSGTGLTVAPTLSAATANNLVVVNIWVNKFTANETVVTVTDDKLNTYVVSAAKDSTNRRIYQAYGVQTTGGATVFTVTFSGATALKHCSCAEYSGAATSNAAAFDVSTNGTSETGTNLSASTLTPAQTGNLIVATMGLQSTRTFTAGTNYTLYAPSDADPVFLRSEYRLSSGSSETAPSTIDSTTPWTVIATSFNPPVTVLSASVIDNITVAETVTRDYMLEFSAIDNITVAETVAIDNQLNPNIVDNITVAETVAIDNQLNPNIVDNITVAETLGTDLMLDVNVLDNITLAETITIEAPFDVSVIDNITVAETTSAAIDLGDIVVIDNITVAEFNDFFFDSWNVSVIDNITLAETVAMGIDLGDIVIVDNITVAENVSTAGTLGDISVNESMTVSDAASLSIDLGSIVAIENITVAETVSIIVIAVPFGVVHMRSKQQVYPTPMDSSIEPMRGKAYPTPMDDSEIF